MHSFGLAIAATLALCLGCGNTSAAAARPTAVTVNPNQTDPLKRSGPARFVTLANIHERIRATSGDLVLLHLWATWCAPCMAELSTMADMARSLPRRNIELLSVSMDNATRKNALRVSQVIDKRADGLLTRAIARIENDDAFMQGLDPRWEGSIPAIMAYLPSGQMVGALYGEASGDEIQRFVNGLLVKRKAQ